MKKYITILIDAIVSIVLIGAILYFMNLEELSQRLVSVDLLYLILSIIFLLIMYGVMITRIKLMLKETGANAPLVGITRSHFVGMLFADFTPARSGYFATAAMLHYRYGVPSEKALISIFGPQIFDFALKVTAGTIGIIFIMWNLLGDNKNPLFFIGSIAMTFVVIIMLLLLFSKRFLKLFEFSKTIAPFSSVYRLFERMQKNSHVVVKKTPELIFLLLLSWSAKAISWYSVAKAVGITLSFPVHEVFFYFFFQPLVTMLEFMPLPTIAGAGASEAAGIYIMSLFGIQKEIGFSMMIVARLKTIFVNLIALPDAVKLTKIGLQRLF
jgi:uncharacterized protein (TIRG00374 family)